ncbi:MAG: hypothetical protein Q8910_00975, partial [Bacteroidota bacterium]|nr:hypothetical protein [Bacteroidota bacterium]
MGGFNMTITAETVQIVITIIGTLLGMAGMHKVGWLSKLEQNASGVAHVINDVADIATDLMSLPETEIIK